MNKEKTRICDFSRITVRDIDGNAYMVTTKPGEKEPYDFAKTLGNGLFYGGKDLRISELGQKIYHHEAVELTEEEFGVIRQFIDSNFVPFVLLSVNPQLDEIMK